MSAYRLGLDTYKDNPLMFLWEDIFNIFVSVLRKYMVDLKEYRQKKKYKQLNLNIYTVYDGVK